MFLRILPFIISMILMAAHFLREGNVILVIIFLAVPLILFIKKRWALLSALIFDLAAVLLWALTAFELVQARLAAGADWIRMFLILLAVAAFTAWAGYLLNGKLFKERYK